MHEYLIAVAAIVALNLLPAIGPPTWSILDLLPLNFDLAPAIIVPAGAVAAACGRFVLATASRRLRGHFSAERLANLAAAEEALTANRSTRRPMRAATSAGAIAKRASGRACISFCATVATSRPVASPPIYSTRS